MVVLSGIMSSSGKERCRAGVRFSDGTTFNGFSSSSDLTEILVLVFGVSPFALDGKRNSWRSLTEPLLLDERLIPRLMRASCTFWHNLRNFRCEPKITKEKALTTHHITEKKLRE